MFLLTRCAIAGLKQMGISYLLKVNCEQTKKDIASFIAMLMSTFQRVSLRVQKTMVKLLFGGAEGKGGEGEYQGNWINVHSK